MGALTFLLTWTGYAVMTYGLALVRGCNVKFSEVAVPKGFLGMNKGGYTGCHADVKSPIQVKLDALAAQYNADIASGNTKAAAANKAQGDALLKAQYFG